MDSDTRDFRKNSYTKHGRDTPAGRAKYESGRWKHNTLQFKVQTAENPNVNWNVYATKSKGRNQICCATLSSNPEILDTVQKCLNCNKYTTYSELCKQCTSPDQRLEIQPPYTGELVEELHRRFSI